MDAANQRAHDDTMALLRGVLSGGRDDLVEMFEKHAERGPDDELYIRVETAADLVVDMRAGKSETHDPSSEITARVLRGEFDMAGGFQEYQKAVAALPKPHDSTTGADRG